MGGQSAFRAGLLFHTYVDDFWNGYVRQFEDELFAVIPHTRPAFHALKILQDIYLYTELSRWAEVTDWFDAILPEELTYGASEGLVRRWHAMLKGFLARPPEENDLTMLTLSLSEEMVAEIRTLLMDFQEIPLLEEILTGFYPKFKAHLL
jgi:hypothetical protein